ncbi:hypothetical protein [Streptomyces scabiei]|uniref:hypothetical protein n=1 Tax=Streptomyces scabiei TaxID=1930 RepID=UPI0029A742F7|nr:hypothetical protein [Streptomyces scabiei]MDX3524744.1 hypothetical protein [Streptomyces scabiei]
MVSPVAGEAAPRLLSCDGERGTADVRVAAVAFRAYSGLGEEDTVMQWRALIVLGTAQFLMVRDTSVMKSSSG